jgi:hypothetical protein
MGMARLAGTAPGFAGTNIAVVVVVAGTVRDCSRRVPPSGDGRMGGHLEVSAQQIANVNGQIPYE